MFIHLVIKIKKTKEVMLHKKSTKVTKSKKAKKKKRLTCNVKSRLYSYDKKKKIVKINCINALLISVFENVRIR